MVSTELETNLFGQTDCQMNEFGTTIAAGDDQGSLIVLNVKNNQSS